LIGVLWILAVHRRQHSNRWRRWRTWLAHAVCSCHVPQLQNAPPPPPQHPTSDEGHSWRRRASSQHHGTGIVDGILCILCRCRCVQRRRTPSILRPHARAERALPERLLALTVSSHLLFTQKYAGRFTDIADSRHVKLAGFQFSRLAGFKFFTTSVGKSRKNMLAVSRALGLSMASSASSAAVAVCSVVARPRFFAHMREPSARFLSGYSLSPYLHIFSSRKNMLAVSPTSPILATSSSLVFSFHDSPVSSFSQLRLGNHAKTCWPFHADFADSRRTLASRHVGQDRRSAAVLWFERLLLLCGV